MRRVIVAVALAALAVASAAGSPPRTVQFVIQLKLDSARIDRDLAAGRRITSPAALGARYGLPLAKIRLVERVLQAHGIEVVRDYPQRTVVDVRAPRATIPAT